MEWWLRLIVAYCTLTYSWGIFIGFIYLTALKGTLDKKFLALYIVLSPLFVPWWMLNMIIKNKE